MRKVLLAALLGLLVGQIAFAVDIKSLIGSQDINWGTGTFDRRTSTGSTISLDKVDSSKVPLKSASGYYVDDLFDGEWGLTIYPSTITGSGAGTISGFSSITGTQGVFTTDNITTANVTNLVVGGGTTTTKMFWGATASVADNGTVTHGVGSAPTAVICTPSTAGEMCSVTAIAATTFTVALKAHGGGAGTTQTVYWVAFK